MRYQTALRSETVGKMKVVAQLNIFCTWLLYGGAGWIRTNAMLLTDLQSAPFNHSGTAPYLYERGQIDTFHITTLSNRHTFKPLFYQEALKSIGKPHKNAGRHYLERETRIELASLAWKARVLPLNYSRRSGLAA